MQRLHFPDAADRNGVIDVEKRLLLILNPKAGQKRANRFLPDIIRTYNELGYECVTYVTACSGDAARHVMEMANRFEHIVCIGGDGTLNETISGLTQSGANSLLGYIPAGTTNDYARSLGLSTDIMQAARDAVCGAAHYFDLGVFNGRRFTYTASCGAFAKVSYSTSQAAKNLLGHTAYILEGILDLQSIRPIHMKVEWEDQVLEDNFIFCSITNSISIGGILKLDPKLVDLSDGVFEVLLIKFPANPVQLTRILMALRSSDMNCDLLHFFKAEKLRITTEKEIEWTLDGERGECSCEFEIVNMHNGIHLMLPDANQKALPAEEMKGESEDQLSN